MNIRDELLTIAEHALCWDYGVKSEAYFALNKLTKWYCGLDLADFTSGEWDDEAECSVVCVPSTIEQEFKDALSASIEDDNNFHTDQTIDYSPTIRDQLEESGGYMECYESANHAVTLALLETEGKPGITMHPNYYPTGTWALVETSILPKQFHVFLGTKQEVEERLSGKQPELVLPHMKAWAEHHLDCGPADVKN